MVWCPNPTSFMVGRCAGTRGGRGVRATAGGEEEEEEVDEAIEVLLRLLDSTGLLNDDANTYREKPILKSQCPSIFTIESRYMENFSESFFRCLLHCQS